MRISRLSLAPTKAMLKIVGAVLVAFLTVAAARAQVPELKTARAALLQGNYAEARSLYTEKAKQEALRVPATIGLSKAHESVGEYTQALGVIVAALKDQPTSADLLARQAELLYQSGKWDEADQAVRSALAQEKDNFVAHWIQGQLTRDRGDWTKANDEFLWFVRDYNARSKAGKDVTDPDELLCLGLAVSERARFFHQTDQFQFILNELYNEAVKRDRQFWPAEYEAGRLFQEKFNNAASDRAYDRALIINPRAAPVLAAKGISAMQRLEVKDAETYAEQALKINPNQVDALRLRAELLLFGGDSKGARAALDKARALNPRDEDTLGRLAALAVIERKENEVKELVADVEKFDAKPSVFYFQLADGVENQKLYNDAETYFRKSMELNPELPRAMSGLGLLYMRLGKEDEAKKLLDKAFEADAFNVRVSNTLKVLRHLKPYTTVKTEHFILRFDSANDKVLARVMLKYLEEIYQEFSKQFDYHPPEPILIEIFNRHEMFSGRVVALPDLHTIGASTGRMIAMVSPHDTSGVIAEPFNWVRVIRHELVHVFNLEQTSFRVPHWFTEGLAVTNEGADPPPRWKVILAEKLEGDQLLNLDNILLGFVRPRSPDEWTQAYAQSQLYVEYLTKTYGEPAIGKLLAAYASGHDTDTALETALHVTKPAFEKAYRAYLKEKLPSGLIQATQKSLSLKALKEALTKNPEDPDLAARLADRYYLMGNKTEARKLADQALTANKNHALAAYVKAMLLIDGGTGQLAKPLLEAVVTEDCKEPKAIKLLGKLQFDSKKYEEAAKTFELGRKLEPFETSWTMNLAKVYKQADDMPKLLKALEELVQFDTDDLISRRKLSEMLLKAGDNVAAERYSREALEIDVMDMAARETFREALIAQHKDQEWATWERLLTKD